MRDRRSRRRAWIRRGLGAGTLFLAAGLVETAEGRCTAAAPRDTRDGGQDLDTSRALLEKLNETRRAIEAAKKSWSEDRALVEGRIEVLTGQVEDLREQISTERASGSDLERQYMELEAKKAAMEDATLVLSKRAPGLESKLEALLPKLPPPLAGNLALQTLASVLFPEDTKGEEGTEEPAKAAEHSLGERYAAILTILQAVQKFDQEVTLGTDVLALGDGRSAEVRTLYLGIGRAYYLGLGGDTAGFGVATADGWRWRADVELAAVVAQAIEIREGKPPVFVRVPARVE